MTCVTGQDVSAVFLRYNIAYVTLLYHERSEIATRMTHSPKNRTIANRAIRALNPFIDALFISKGVGSPHTTSELSKTTHHGSHETCTVHI